eukprot:g28449.t1
MPLPQWCGACLRLLCEALDLMFSRAIGVVAGVVAYWIREQYFPLNVDKVWCASESWCLEADADTPKEAESESEETEEKVPADQAAADGEKRLLQFRVIYVWKTNAD